MTICTLYLLLASLSLLMFHNRLAHLDGVNKLWIDIDSGLFSFHHAYFHKNQSANGNMFDVTLSS